MNAHNIGPWRLRPNEVVILLWIVSTYEAEGVQWGTNLTGRTSSALSKMRKMYGPFDTKSMLRLLSDVDRTGFSVPCTTLWGEQLYCPKSCRQYYCFLLRMCVGTPEDGKAAFLDRVLHPLEIHEGINDLLKPFLPRLPCNKHDIEWGRSSFGPGEFSNPHHRKSPYISTWIRLLLMFSKPYPYSRPCSVPKTWKSDRLIASEPLENQIRAKPVARYLMMQVERYSRGSVRFSDQDASRRACRVENATIDLSNASDRVQLRHVETTMPEWYGLLKGVRTKQFVLAKPERVYNLAPMFATMGSFLTFPVETWVFYSYTYAILKMCGATSDELKAIKVYGDDIIVPAKFAEEVIDFLEDLGFEVNRTKSYWRAEEPFRETCGAETWNNVDITPARMPRGTSLDWLRTFTVPQLVALISNFSEKGLYITADVLYQYVFACHQTGDSNGDFLGLRSDPKLRAYLFRCLMKIGVNDSDSPLWIDSPLSPWREGSDLSLPARNDALKRVRYTKLEDGTRIHTVHYVNLPEITADLLGGDYRNFRKFLSYFLALSESQHQPLVLYLDRHGNRLPDYLIKDSLTSYSGLCLHYTPQSYRQACWLEDPRKRYHKFH